MTRTINFFFLVFSSILRVVSDMNDSYFFRPRACVVKSQDGTTLTIVDAMSLLFTVDVP